MAYPSIADSTATTNFRLAHNLEKRAAALAPLGRRRPRDFNELHDRHRDQDDHHDSGVSTGEFHRLEEIDADFRQLRPDEGRYHAARQHEGYRLAPKLRARRIGCGEPIVLPERVMDAEQ